jgi:hypothetical protein
MTTTDSRSSCAEPTMLQTVQCPHCGRKLAVDPRHAGRALVCPMCQQSFTPAVEEEALPIAQPENVTADPPRDEPRLTTTPARPAGGSAGRAFAEREGIDLDEEHLESVSGKNSAERQLSDWRESMPEVPSAYVPSGRLPVGGVIALGVGSLVGALGSALAFLVVGAVVFGLTLAIFALVAWMSETCGRVLCILVLLGIAVGVLGGACTYGLQGWLAAVITTACGVAGKNRNVPAAVVFSIGSCVMGLVLSSLALDFVGDRLIAWLAPEEANKPDPWTWHNWVILAAEGVGCLIAVVVAGFSSRNMVRESKFCEDCEESMNDQTKRGLGLGPTKAVVRALAGGEHEAAADLMASPEGKCGVPTLFWCPKCEKGYLEVQAKFKCTWTKGDENEEKEEEWLAASVPLEPEHVELFRERPRKRRADSDE